MSNVRISNGRRRFLTATTSIVGGIGAMAIAVPFIKSWNPSEKAKAAGAPVEVNISKLADGQMIRVEWRGKPVWIVRRSKAVLQQLVTHDDQLRDPASEEPQQPAYAQNLHRSLKPEIFLAVGICTHLGCSPTYLPNSLVIKSVVLPLAFFVHVTVQPLIWLGECLQASPHRLIWWFHRINS